MRHNGGWDQESSGSSQEEEKKRWSLSCGLNRLTPGNPKLARGHRPVIPGLQFMDSLSNTVKPYVKKKCKNQSKNGNHPKWGDQHSLGRIIY